MPPALWSAASRMRSTPRTYPTFAAAATAAGANDGYASSDLARITLQKTLIARKKGLTELAWHNGAALYIGLTYTAALLQSKSLRVLDFGGSLGFHAMVCAKVLPEIATRWAVIESPTLASVARPIESESLRVFTRLDDAVEWLGGVDLMHSSGTVQCLQDPDQTIRSLAGLGAPVLLWQRMMFAHTERTYVVKTYKLSEDYDGLGRYLPEGFEDRPVRMPLTYVTEAELQSACGDDYRLVIRVPPFDDSWDHGLATFGTVLLYVRRQEDRLQQVL